MHGRPRRRKISRREGLRIIDGLTVSVSHTLSEIPEADWDSLGRTDYPFTRHCFLYGLELHDCLEPFGWFPVYFQVHRGEQLLAGMPCYIKTNAYGELVFDHAWENAYQRNGLDYYPKLVTAIPYTPATGERFLFNLALVGDDETQQQLRLQLCQAIKQFCLDQKLSSWHILFAEQEALSSIQSENILLRNDIQFHWQNHDYHDFDDFLSRLSSRKRKNIKKERKEIEQHGLTLSIENGHALDSDDWQRIHDLYASIYYRKYGTATLNADFFRYLGETMPDQVLVAAGRDQGEIVAASLFFRSDTHLYGRIWGCDDFYRQLHFECCYYQGIDYCIAHKLAYFDPGAQGEHKLSRGFLPTLTWSGHWLAIPQFSEAIEKFLEQERPHIRAYQEQLMQHSPFKQLDHN